MTSRRNPAADKAAQNQQVIKSLLKLPGNKHCADCKRNAHPRWASWNLGIFICIRCSGLHRGMGTHISRVKSVDLDTWTEEQLQSMLRWGNSRANKYWEAKLATGHVPSEAKIENFVRTKYESKRWVMEGEMPDPATLADSDEDDTPLRVVQEKQKAEAARSPTSPKAAAPQVDLFNDNPMPGGQKVSAPPPPRAQQQTPVAAAPQKQPTKPADSLLGLDFFSPSPSVSPRPPDNSANQMGGASSRPDLNRSILSLYSSAPKQQPKTHQPTNSDSFSSYTSPTQPQHSSMGGLRGLDDAFGGLSFSTAPTAAPPQPAAKQPSPFDSLTAGFKSGSNSSGMMGSSNRNTNPSMNFGKAAPVQASSTSSGFGDLFDLSAPTKSAPAPAPSYASSKPATSNTMSFDNAWSSPQPAAQSNSAAAFDWNTTSAAPPKKATVTADDDFGAFSTGGFSSPPAAQPASKSAGANGGKPVAYDDDIFQNVWS